MSFYFMSLTKVKPRNLKPLALIEEKQNKHLNLFYFQHLQLPHSKTDDAEFLRGAFTPSKLQLI
jgi:hypothetical protein